MVRRVFISLLWGFVFYFGACVITGGMPDAPPVTATVARVIDGDTVELRIGDRTVKARIVGIDAPRERPSDEARRNDFGVSRQRIAREPLDEPASREELRRRAADSPR